MTTVNIQLVASKKTTLANTPEEFYESPSNQSGTVITNFTSTNDTATAATYKAYIVSSSGSPTIPVVPERNITSNRTDVSPEMSGQFIPPGGTLQMEASVANTLSFTVSGREIS